MSMLAFFSGSRLHLRRAAGLLLLTSLALGACSDGGGNAAPPPPASGGVTADGCASLTSGAQTVAGERRDSGSGAAAVKICVYADSFVDFNRPLTTSITLSDDVDRHVFRGSVVVGANASNNAELAAAGIAKGGDGPKLSIEAGVVVAFSGERDSMVINRGSQIDVQGTASKPVSFTHVNDPSIGGGADPESSQLWGGLVINGFGVVNGDCQYIGSRGSDDFAVSASGCHVQSEGLQGGQATHYGGDNDADSSGSLGYLIIKYAGSEVSADNELNGLSFNAVGSGTTVSHLQVYRSYDDGVEFFGGSVNLSNYLALYVADDSIDIDSGYNGTISNALIIQAAADGNRCVEADGISSYSAQSDPVKAGIISQGLASRPTLRNITCIISANEASDAGAMVPDNVKGTHGDAGEGLRLREGLRGSIEGLIVTNAYSVSATSLAAFNASLPAGEDGWANNWCLDIDNAETTAAAAAGDLTISRSIFACSEAVDADSDMVGSMTESAWLATQSEVYQADLNPLVNPGATTDAGLALFAEGSYTTLATTDMAVPAVTSLALASQPGYTGGGADWTTGWTIGLDSLWFAPTSGSFR